MSDLEIEIEFSDDDNIIIDNKGTGNSAKPLINLSKLNLDIGGMTSSVKENKMCIENEPKRISNNSQQTCQTTFFHDIYPE